MPIKVLDAKLVAQIAAGEVVERPASVAKELVENSLDAGATQISVAIEDGGVKLIRVTDNGAGIPAAEVELAFQRHATSKIGSLSDLDNIHTLGFRGEALPSIAAVAEVDVVSRAAGEATGTHLTLTDGAVAERRVRGHPPGTTITVSRLFQRVPARLKFLKSRQTENGHVATVVTQYALAFPGVSFAFSVDGRETLRTLGGGRLPDVVLDIYGAEVARSMLPVGGKHSVWQSGTTTSVEVTGLAGTPSVSRAGRNGLSFFVNGRWVNSRLLAAAVEEAYRGLLMVGRHPVAVVSITLPARDVDANIHPTKTEVKFSDERAVFTAVQRAVRQALVEHTPVPEVEDFGVQYASRPATKEVGRAAAAAALDLFDLPPGPKLPNSLPVLRLLGQMACSYVVAEGEDGLYVIDQHAAHERVLFEEINGQMSQQKIAVQGLLEPVTLEVTPAQAEVMRVSCQRLAEFGFAIEPFGERTYLVRAVPALLHGKDWHGALRELLDSPGVAGADRTEGFAATMACHAAVRAGQVLTDDEMRQLVRRLEQTALPRTCPHGRPTVIQMSSGRLAREFGRS